MKAATVFTASINVELNTGPDLRDITPALEKILKKSGINHGILYATVVGSTGSITSIEVEPGVVQDLKDAIERIAPQDISYAHEQAWHDGNGHSHLQATMMGPSLTVPVSNGDLVLGTWQQIFHLECDVKPRNRSIVVTVIGD